VELAVAIFKCRADSVSQDPLVLCAGGPGLSNIDDFVPGLVGGLGNLFLNTRDVVIIESRGLKYSKPYLNVPGFEQLQLSLLEKNLTADQTINMYLDTLQVAYDRFTAQGIDLSAINSLEISNEIAYVMEQLGYEQFSMFGTSYGTEVVQYMLMNHADRLNSVVMNGTMDTSLGGYHMHTSLIEILESLFNTIEADPIYSEAYPNLKKRFLEKISELNLKPETIQIKYLKKSTLGLK
jgi:pimeloyl-ACP methyl ester carboxylesterase